MMDVLYKRKRIMQKVFHLAALWLKCCDDAWKQVGEVWNQNVVRKMRRREFNGVLLTSAGGGRCGITR